MLVAAILGGVIVDRSFDKSYAEKRTQLDNQNESYEQEQKAYYKQRATVEFCNELWDAAFGFYTITVNEGNDNMDEGLDFSKLGGDSEEVAQIRQMLYGQIRDCYMPFVQKLSRYNMHYYVETGEYHRSDSSLDKIAVEARKNSAQFYIKASFDEMGNMTLSHLSDEVEANILVEEINSNIRNEILNYTTGFERYMEPMTIYIYAQETNFFDIIDQEYIDGNYRLYSLENIDYMIVDNYGAVMVILSLLVIAAAWILLSISKLNLRESILTRIPLLVVIVSAFTAVGFYVMSMGAHIKLTVDNSWVDVSAAFNVKLIWVILTIFITEILVFISAAGIYSVATLGPIKYLKEKTVTVTVVRWSVNHLKRFVNSIAYSITGEKKYKTLVKVVLINGLLVALLCCMWFAGLLGVIIYSIVVLILGRRFLDKIDEQYEVVHEAVKQMAEGNLNADMEGDAGFFQPVKEDLAKVREGVKIAVEEEVKSQKMKSELITNVSHDLKTPLTAIITYTNLLKDENITDKERSEYVAILDNKANRLKKLIEDLFEVSKADSGNIKVNKAVLDLVDLIRQASLEYEDKLKAADIDMRIRVPENKVMADLDGEKMYRILDNLLGNVVKYSVKGTRAFITLEESNGDAIITVRNISSQELPEDVGRLTERFVRGDESRNTEGSGLGLAIVRSFVEVQGGIFNIYVDGDLFKVTMIFKTCNNK